MSRRRPIASTHGTASVSTRALAASHSVVSVPNSSSISATFHHSYIVSTVAPSPGLTLMTFGVPVAARRSPGSRRRIVRG